jgi:transposase
LASELALSELATKHDVHPTMIVSWKRQTKDGMASVFSGKAAAVKKDGEGEIRDLYAKIGQTTMKKDGEGEIRDLYAKIGQTTMKKDFMERSFALR